jgi:hypothetical protein
LSTRADSILGSATPTARLLAALEPEAAREIDSAMALLKRVQQWEQAGGFEQASEVRAFIAAAGGERAAIEHLRSLLSAADITESWRELFAAYEAARATHRAAYGRAHANLRTAIADATAEIESDPNAPSVSDELARLQALGCMEAEPDVVGPPFTCPSCRRSLADLQRDLLEVDAHLPRLRRRLQAVRIERESASGPLQPYAARATVADPKDVEPLTAGLQAYAELALRDGPIEVAITAQPRPDND